jgi:hypothetical protein
MMRSLIYALSALAVAGTAWAEPGAGFDCDPTEALKIIEPPAGRSCDSRSGVCLYAAGRSTVAVESPSQPVASAKKAAQPVKRFTRAHAVAQAAGGKPSVANGPWTIEVQATLKRAAVAGNALFILFDNEDPQALENHEYTAMYQTSIHAGRSLAARLSFQPDEGFRAGHTYRLRVVQLLGGKEVLLTEADLSLL